MVKPTLKPDPEKEKKEDDLKDDKLKEWGILPAAVVIDETEKEKDKKDAEAAITELENLETDVDDAPRPLIVKFCACFAVFTVVLIIVCTIGSFLYFHHANKENHKWKGWCSVKYDGDNDNGGSSSHGSREGGRHGGHHGGHHGDSSEEGHEGRPNWRYPRPTGPPGGRTCNQQTEVDTEEQYERIERPQEEDCERLTILHDFNSNMSAYRLWKSEVCYVTWIEQEVLMDPEEFWTNMQDPEYLNQYFSTLSMTYRAVLPAIPTPLHEQENGKYGEYLDGPKEFICDGAETYWIEKIPEEEIEAFMAFIEEIIRELIAIAESDEQQHEGERQEGGHGGEEEMPWEDDEFGGDRDDWPIDRWPMGYRPHDFPGMPDHGRGHPGAGHGGEREHHGARKRRGIPGYRGGYGQLSKKAKDAYKCMQMPNIKYIIGQGKVAIVKVVNECLVGKAAQKQLNKKGN